MTELRFLVVHGALFWKVLLIVLVTITTTAWFLVQRWRGALRRRSWFAAPIAAVLWYGLLYYIGMIELENAAHYGGHGIDPQLVVAAAMPVSRDGAITRLRELRSLGHDDEGLQTGLALDRYFDRCPDERLFDAARFEETIAYAGTCGRGDIQIASLIALGRYAHAADLIDGNTNVYQAMTVLIAAGRMRDAGELLERVIPHDRAHECFSRLLLAFAGDAGARAQVSSEHGDDDCGIIGAVARGDRIAHIDDHASLRRLSPIVSTQPDPHELRWMMHDHDPVMWLASDEEARGRIAMLRGRFSDAHAALVVSDRAVAVELAAHEGAPLPALTRDQSLTAAEEGRRGLIAKNAEDYEALMAAAHGDGGPLARLIRRDQLWWNVRHEEVLGVAPLIVEYRDELARALRFFHANDGVGRSPFTEIVDDAVYRDTARLVGDIEQAARWQAIIDRHAAVLDDRERAIAMAIWQTLH